MTAGDSDTPRHRGTEAVVVRVARAWCATEPAGWRSQARPGARRLVSANPSAPSARPGGPGATRVRRRWLLRVSAPPPFDWAQGAPSIVEGAVS